jgi:hypothetical protein
MLQVGTPCGLFNRVDVITTGYVLAEMRGEKEIEVLWPVDKHHMPVSFYELFTALPRGRVLQQDIEPRFYEEYNAAMASLPSDYRHSDFFREMLRLLLSNAVPEVQAEVSAFVEEHFQSSAEQGASTVGIHVRRSGAEHPQPLSPFAQPLRYYEAVIRSFPPETRFFVSTDSQFAFRWLQSRFGDRVFQKPKVHDNRSSASGVREGLVDLLLLSRCSAIIGTYRSSFSGIASLVGPCPVLLIRTFPDVPADWPSFSRWRWVWGYRHFLVESTIWQRWFIWSYAEFIRPWAVRLAGILTRLIRHGRLRGTALPRPDASATSRQERRAD